MKEGPSPRHPSPCLQTTDIYQFGIKRVTTAVWDNLTAFNPTPNLTFEEIVDPPGRPVETPPALPPKVAAPLQQGWELSFFFTKS